MKHILFILFLFGSIWASDRYDGKDILPYSSIESIDTKYSNNKLKKPLLKEPDISILIPINFLLKQGRKEFSDGLSASPFFLKGASGGLGLKINNNQILFTSSFAIKFGEIKNESAYPFGDEIVNEDFRQINWSIMVSYYRCIPVRYGSSSSINIGVKLGGSIDETEKDVTDLYMTGSTDHSINVNFGGPSIAFNHRIINVTYTLMFSGDLLFSGSKDAYVTSLFEFGFIFRKKLKTKIHLY